MSLALARAAGRRPLERGTRPASNDLNVYPVPDGDTGTTWPTAAAVTQGLGRWTSGAPPAVARASRGRR